MSHKEGLWRGELGASCVHLCLDMQGIFAEGSPWETPWLPRVLPTVERIVAAHPERTIFTRFIPADRPGEGTGTWKDYYERWADMTLERLEPGKVDLLPELKRYVPPAEVIDKTVYSPWMTPELGAEPAPARGGGADHHRDGDRRLRAGRGARARSTAGIAW